MTVVVTRPGTAGLELVAMLEQNNIPAIHLPLFTFTDGEELHLLTEQLNSLKSGDWIFPVSIQAIEFTNKQLIKQNQKWPQNVNYLAVGKKSAEKLSFITKQNVLYPSHKESSEGLLDLFHSKNLNLQKFLILRAKNGRNLFANYLRHRGTEVKLLNCYNREQICYSDSEILSKLTLSAIFIVTSQANLIALDKLFVDNKLCYKNYTLITISARLVTIAQQLGWKDVQLSEKVNNQFLYNAVQSIYK